LFDFWGRSFGFVKAMQTCDHAADLIFAGQMFLQQFVQKATARQLAHFDCVFYNFAVRFKREA